MTRLEIAKPLGIILSGLLFCASGWAQSSSKTAKAAPAKAAPAAKPAVTKPAGTKPGGATTTASHGPTTAGAAHGPTTAGGARGPVTTSSPRVSTAAGGARPGAAAAPHAMAGGRPVSAAGRPVPAGSRMVAARNGGEVRMRPNGRPGDVHLAGRGMDIHHNLNGNRRIEVERRDGTRIVAERGGRGYVQHPYMFHSHEYGHRTYYYHGRAYDRFYRHYPYHGIYMDVYSPAYYYRPGFYGWAYNPWVSPVRYSWGWAGNPWYGYYGSYFTPYSVYGSASLWLTDYMISTSLAAAYQARVDAAAQTQVAASQLPPDAAPLSPAVKDLISQEVQRQVALENAEAQGAAQNAESDPSSSGIQRMMTDNIQHVFLVGRDLDVTDNNGQECALSNGDALQLTTPAAAGGTTAGLVVLSTKGNPECGKNVLVNVSVADLQDMQNHMRETIDQGMGEMQAKQGKGLPALPPSAAGAPVKATFAAAPDTPGPDPTAATEIAQQSKEADQAETETLGQVAQNGGPAAATPDAAPPAAPVNLSLGMSVDEVVAAEGQPKSIVNLGTKKIYIFKDMKVTFKDDKVADIQ